MPAPSSYYARVHFYRTIAFTFLFLTVVAVAVVFYFIFVRAEVVVTVATEPFRTHFIADVVPKSTITGVISGERLAGMVGKVSLTASRSSATTGRKTIADTQADGIMRVVNTTVSAQTLVATTRFLASDGLLLRTREYVRVPAQGSAEVPVYVTDETWAGTLEKETHFTIPGLRDALQDVIYGELAKSLTHGVAEISTVKEIDTVKLEHDLQTQVEKEAKSIFEREQALTAQDIVRYLVDFGTTEWSNAAGEVAENLSATTTITLTGVVYPYAAFTELRKAKLTEALPDDKVWQDGTPVLADVTVETVDAEKGMARLSVQLETSITTKQQGPLFDKNVLTGLTPDEVRVYYETFPQVTSVTVTLRPKWLTTLPEAVERIDLRLVTDGGM
ncbi:MAG: hypothetical protein COT39_01185 [Parcubacteria group bacterium CG08_land_8_20_14_0_20_48_21]|nr:MAG: hypothetical protein AUK21_01980 [Parcubacteria group bacterium CG2_30_48_51]PIS33068.1 MAG: hypothetical protein COT39_01185 [Parcubacteria group bacterium CG08_land_8_20_14_0_20_48_21]PIW79208.1 MAG: hypothetical protein COZ99_02170 [Parcubacteria group bacterium CG_4_8_14_3_um_filter_48_16]PIY77861.1 MAG: hypothetical protein COY83_02915 [Parcubacteria group bacterium CG_4_10_14_0_8_um_filter_48_154]PIZ77329.1 MAG: hypothetical protein COY03_03305 [bacterium CG_4_10_14_0_2_um_filter_